MDTNHASLDRLFEVLAKRRQRFVLYYFDEVESSVATLEEIAAKLCTWERDWMAYTAHPRGKHQDHIRIDLHHVHLPEMADVGLVDYDARTGTVRSRVDDSLLAAVQQDSAECSRLEALFTNVEVKT